MKESNIKNEKTLTNNYVLEFTEEELEEIEWSIVSTYNGQYLTECAESILSKIDRKKNNKRI